MKRHLAISSFFAVTSFVCVPLQAGLFDPFPPTLLKGYSVDVADNLRLIDMVTGQTSIIGSLGAGYTDVEGLSFHPLTGVLYGFNNGGAKDLITINTSTGAATTVGPSGLSPFDQTDVGLAFRRDGSLFASTSAQAPTFLYDVNPATGAFVNPRSTGRFISALAFDGLTLYGVSSQDAAPNPTLVEIDIETGVPTPVGGGLGIADFPSAGLASLPGGILVLLTEGSPGSMYVIDKETGLAAFVANVAPGTFESFAILVTPEPASVCVWLVMAVICGAGVRQLRRRDR